MNAIAMRVSAAALALILVPVVAAAQTFPIDTVAAERMRADRATVGDLRLSLNRLVRESGAVADRQTQTPASQSSAPRERSVTRKFVGGALGAVGGFFGGLFLGAALEPDCNCDDPGFKGALIGAPIGAIVGGIVGAKWF